LQRESICARSEEREIVFVREKEREREPERETHTLAETE